MNLAPPSSQKAADRPISFLLDDQSGVGSGEIEAIDLVIRPEELSRNSPSRISVNQTLGGAWADSFGAGIDTIQLSGHTGWRRVESGRQDDGTERFQQLHAGVYTQWHERRRAAAEAGKDPDKVKLIFSDALDNFSVVVAPMAFVLRRSKSRPLLSQFQISLTVVNEDIDSDAYFQYGVGGKLGYLIRGESTSGGGMLESLGLTSLSGSLNSLQGIIGGIKSMVTNAVGYLRSSIVGPIMGFVKQAQQVIGAVRGAIAGVAGLVRGVVGQVIGLARSVAGAGMNLFRTLSSVLGLPGQIKSFFMGAASSFSNILCVLSNAINQRLYTQDYSSLYGSSNCSSTSGGRAPSDYALTGANPFYDIFPVTDTVPFNITEAATGGLTFLSNLSSAASVEVEAGLVVSGPTEAQIDRVVTAAGSVGNGISTKEAAKLAITKSIDDSYTSVQTKSAAQVAAEYMR